MIGEIMLYFLLIAMGFSIGFSIGAEWRKKELTSKIPRRFYHKDRWYMIFYKEDIIMPDPFKKPLFHASQLKTWQGDKK